MKNRAGSYRINLKGESAYSSFLPAPLPPDPPIMLSEELAYKLSKARAGLAVLEANSSKIPNLELYISMEVVKEALLSSRIEGTQATLEDVLDPEVEANANLDAGEVIGYVRALKLGVERMKQIPISGRLLKEVHAEFMKGVRGQDKSPGEFRKSQNWIGPAGGSMKNARFVPPSPMDMEEAFSDLEKFINREDRPMDPLIEGALIHYQFETIHPFLDGNGRVGRLLMVLHLLERGLLSSPCLYASYSFKKNREEYYSRLGKVRENGDYEQWVIFFLDCMASSAEAANLEIEKLSSLHRNSLSKIEQTKRARFGGRKLLHYLEAHPIISIGKTAEELGLSYNAVSSMVAYFIKMGILKQNKPGKRNRLFSYWEYMDILKEGTE